MSTQLNTSVLPTLASSSVLGSLNISQYTARKKDKKTETEVIATNNAQSKKAASVYKNLFAECRELEAITSYAADCRVWFNHVTLPWDDNGARIIPTASYFDVMAEVGARTTKFNALVQAFIKVYSTEVSAKAFTLGSLFDRSEYPDISTVAQKFAFSVNVSPMPLAGDFRVDIANDTLTEMREQYEKASTARVAEAMTDAFMRLKNHAEKVRDRLRASLEFDPTKVKETEEYDADGKLIKLTVKTPRRPKLYESMLDNGLELCGIMSSLNVLNDPKLEDIRRELQRALTNADIESLRESTEAQESLKKKMDDLIDKFDF